MKTLDSTNPLTPFARLIGGEWYYDGKDGAYTHHHFEWGVGQKTVISRSYAPDNNGEVLVSEGFWFWHPAEQTIKGYHIAIGMPVEVFEYTTTFEGNKMVSELRATNPEGAVANHIETWQFTDEDHYVCTVDNKTPAGPQKWLELSFIRKSGNVERGQVNSK